MRFARLIATGTATCSIIGASTGVGVIFAGFLKDLAKNPELEKTLVLRTDITGSSPVASIALKLFNVYLLFILDV